MKYKIGDFVTFHSHEKEYFQILKIEKDITTLFMVKHNRIFTVPFNLEDIPMVNLITPEEKLKLLWHQNSKLEIFVYLNQLLINVKIIYKLYA